MEKLTRIEVQRQIDLINEPIDLVDLEALGLVKKSGAWYLVPNIQALPESARVKITEMSAAAKGSKVKFRKPEGNKKKVP